MKVLFYTLGCKVNQYETQEMREVLARSGFSIVQGNDEPDVCIINSCTVTAESDRKTRQAVNRLRRSYPHAVLVLAGCMPQAYPDNARALPNADILLGNRDYSRLPLAIEEYNRTGERLFRVQQHKTGESFCNQDISAFENRTRAFVKIQDGCDRFCSYCIIPTSRGRSRSKPPAELEREFSRLGAAGFQEIVLVGINLSSYGREFGVTICDAVERAAAVAGVSRVRLGSLEPDHITPEMLDRLAACDVFCPQFHISLQSGCDATLKRMNRHYTSAEYARLCAQIRARFPDAAITTDVMVGFSGETPTEFAASCAFVEQIGFEKVHVFPYSIRPGTRAATFPEQVQKAEKERRAHEMGKRAQAVREAYLHRQAGRTVQVLFETERDGLYHGYTRNYTPVCMASQSDIRTQTLLVRITGVQGDCCTATRVE